MNAKLQNYIIFDKCDMSNQYDMNSFKIKLIHAILVRATIDTQMMFIHTLDTLYIFETRLKNRQNFSLKIDSTKL